MKIGWMDTQQVGGIMKKNFKIKARRPRATFIEIAMPLAYAAFGAGFSMMRTELDAPEQKWFPSEEIGGLACAGYYPIYFAPAGNREKDIMRKVYSSYYASQYAGARLLNAGEPLPLCGQAFSTWEAMRDKFLEEDPNSYRIGVLLDVSGNSSDWSYQIMHTTFKDRANVDEFTRQWVKEDSDCVLGDCSLDGAVGARDGTLALQYFLNRAMANVHTPGAGDQMFIEGGWPLKLAKLPLRALKTGYQPGLTFVLIILPFYMTFGMSYIGAMVIRDLAQEREKKLDEGMKVMGLSAANEKLGNALTIALLQFLAPIATTIIIKLLGFTAYSNHFLVFLLLQLFEYAVIASVFLLLPLCGKAKQAEAVWWLCGIFPSIALFALNAIWPVLGNGLLSDLLPGLFWPCLLFSGAAGPMGMLLFLIAEFEGVGLESATATSYPLLGVIGILIFDIVLYGILGHMLERRRQGLPMWPSKATILRRSTLPVDESQAQASGVVQVVHLSKQFPAKPLPLLAVKDLSFEMKEGEVTALLGQNGAGKSTAINVFTGLCQPTSGYAMVYGHRVPEDMNEVRQIMGVCPQHDLLFETLTVHEHFRLFADIKHLTKQESLEFMDDWLAKLGIKDKINERTGTLSGGQKRKVSCAIALLGSPRFVMLDEPTAGMDPHSRRGVWEAVQQAKPGRAVLLTTHFMDEADALANFVVVMSYGSLCASGTSLELKNQFGDGYRLHTALNPGVDPARTLAATQEFVPRARVEEHTGTDATLLLPQDGVSHFGELFKSLDNRMSELGLSGYGITLPSLQDVFLKIVEKQSGKGAYDDEARAKQAAAAAQAQAAQANASAPFKDPTLKSQLGTMLKGRTTIVWKAGKVQQIGCVIVGSVFMVLGFLIPMLVALDPLPDPLAPPPATIINAEKLASKADVNFTVPYYPRSTFPGTLEYGFDPKPLPGPAPMAGQDLHKILSESIKPNDGIMNAYLLYDEPPENTSSNGTTLLYNSSWPNSLPALLDMFDQALLERAAPGLSITTKVSRIPRSPDAKTVLTPSQNALPLLPVVAPLLYMMTVFLLSAQAVNDVGMERFEGIKHRMLLSGLDVRIYWTSFFIQSVVLLIFLLSFVGLIAAQATSQLLPESILAFLLVTLLGCMAVVLFSFLLTFPLSSPSLNLTVDSFNAYYSFFFMAIVMLPTLFASFLQDEDAKFVIQIIALIIPMNQLVEGMRAICMIDSSLRLRDSLGKGAPSVGDYFILTFDPLELLGLGDIEGAAKTTIIGPGLVLIYGAVCIVVFSFLMWWLEIRKYTVPHMLRNFSGAGNAHGEDEDVVNERERVLRGTDDDLSAQQLRKFFKSRSITSGSKTFKAVDGISFGVPKGTCFALLGPNGAGKTTAINMLTGDTWPSEGTASICGNATADSMLKIFKITGFCPQFKGLWKDGSLRDHLWIFCRLKGLVGADLDREIDRLVLAYGLEEHQHKFVSKCSGGTQRKLSCALALSVGEPRVTFLDEPTTGVDVGTRRFIWDRIKDATRDSVVVLTTHYMDEADALAQQIGIMVGGKLAAIGSPQHLKLRHGRAYRVQLKGPADKESELTDLVMRTFGPKSKLVEGHGGLLSFEVEPGFALSKVFPVFEDAKTSLNLETYSLQQTTLEDVFLNVAGRGETSRPEPAAAAPPAKYPPKVSGSGEAKANLLGRPADPDLGVTEVP